MIDYIIISFTFHGITLANYAQWSRLLFVWSSSPTDGHLLMGVLARGESAITDAYCFAAFQLLCALLSVLLRGIIIRPPVYGTATVLDQSLHSKQIDSLRLEPRATAFPTSATSSAVVICHYLQSFLTQHFTSVLPAQLCHH